ncbi:MAG: hypothetical protein U1E78_04155 [Gammaproteobacteria bacterium]
MLVGFKMTALLNKLSCPPTHQSKPHAIQNSNDIIEILQAQDPMKDYYISCDICSHEKTIKLYAENLVDLQRINQLATLYQGLNTGCDITFYLHPTKQLSVSPRAKL